MTKNEIAQRVFDHLFIQRQRATGEVGCAYRGEDGTTCAVGCLIEDAYYKPAFEGIGIIRARDNEEFSDLLGALEQSGIPTDTDVLNLLVSLQTFHDEEYSAHAFRNRRSYMDMLQSINQVIFDNRLRVDVYKWHAFYNTIPGEE